MKRKTCKILLIIGIILLVFPILSLILYFFAQSIIWKDLFYIFAILSGIEIPIAIILFIVAGIGWNSEKRKGRRERLYNAQMKALGKGKVHVKISGKMRKLR